MSGVRRFLFPFLVAVCVALAPMAAPAQYRARPEPRTRDDVVVAKPAANPAIDKALRSTCWILSIRDGKAFYGTGWLVDKARKQIITNHHVVLNDKEAQVFFPIFKEGNLLVESKNYEGKGIAATILKVDPKRDLALLQLSALPDGLDEIPLADKLPDMGQKLYSIGNSPMNNRQPYDGKLWFQREGKVTKIGFLVFFLDNTKGKGEARTIETDSGFQAGDSGGPILDEKGQLVGVVSSYKIGTNVSWSIHQHELRAFLHNFRKSPREFVSSPVEGYWTMKFNAQNEDKFVGLVFQDNGKLLWDGFNELFPGAYSYKESKLKLDVPKLKINETVTLTWIDNDTFRFTSTNVEFTCTRR